MSGSVVKRYVIAIDSSSSAVETCLFDSVGGHIVHTFTEPIALYSPKEGWFEHDATEIWEKQVITLNKVLEKVPKEEIIGIGIANQRETIVAWDSRTLMPICRAISWQDSRNDEFLSKFKPQKDFIYDKTGLFLNAYFSAGKMSWILKNVETDIEHLRFGTVDSWLIAKMTNGENHLTDVTNASRTMCMNLTKEAWDQELLDLFEIPMHTLPKIETSDSCFGHWNGIPIMGVLGDQQAGLFSLGNRPNSVKCTYGTGLFAMKNAGSVFKKDRKNIVTVAWKLKSQDTVYAYENGSFSCGNILDKLKEEGKFYEYSTSSLSIPMSVYIEPINHRLFLFDESKWNKSVINLDINRDMGDKVIKAFLNGISLIVKKILDDFPGDIDQIYLNGQISNIDYLVKTQSLVLNKPVITSFAGSRSILGVSLLVMMACELIEWRDIDYWNDHHKKVHTNTNLDSVESTSLINLWLCGKNAI